MSFSGDLLDGFDLLYKRTDGVIKSCTEVADFYKGLARIEKEYARSLAKLASAQKAELKKAPPTQKEVGSTLESWEIILTELEKTAEHHSLFSDKLENELAKAILTYIKEKQKVSKRLQTDGKKITTDMKMVLDNLQKTRTKYVTLSKESDGAESVHTKGKGDLTMKPSALLKLAAKATQCADKAAASDNEYQHVLNLTNQKQSEYYTTIMPDLLKEFQQFEEDRIQIMKEISQKFTTLYQDFPAVYSNSASVMSNAASAINIQHDIKSYVNENKTGVTPPSDITYIPYDSDIPATPKKPSGGASRPKVGNYAPNGTPSILDKQEWGLSSSDRQLNPSDQQKKLQGQVDQLDKAIQTEAKAKDGLENLVRFYASDPIAQKKAEDQIAESEDKLQRMQETKNMVQSQLDQLSGNAPASASTPASQVRARGLYDYTATCDTELSFKQGEILSITEQDDSGWWYAELRGQAGFIPNNYVQIVS